MLMWVFTKHGFVAIVQHNTLPDHFQVKSRVVDPLENLWPGHDIEVIDWADYRFRITMPKSDAMRVLEAQIADVDYTSFKTRCESDQDYQRLDEGLEHHVQLPIENGGIECSVN